MAANVVTVAAAIGAKKVIDIAKLLPTYLCRPFKASKDKAAAQRQLMIGFQWDSRTMTRTLEEHKLHAYIDLLVERAGRGVRRCRCRSSSPWRGRFRGLS